MPYIKQDDRDLLDIREVENVLPETAGELNYTLTRVVLNYVEHKTNYQRFNDAIGALECAKLELYRRMVAPYEDIKMAANGDVYE